MFPQGPDNVEIFWNIFILLYVWLVWAINKLWNYLNLLKTEIIRWFWSLCPSDQTELFFLISSHCLNLHLPMTYGVMAMKPPLQGSMASSLLTECDNYSVSCPCLPRGQLWNGLSLMYSSQCTKQIADCFCPQGIRAYKSLNMFIDNSTGRLPGWCWLKR